VAKWAAEINILSRQFDFLHSSNFQVHRQMRGNSINDRDMFKGDTLR
jgi:hypothetical protein